MTDLTVEIAANADDGQGRHDEAYFDNNGNTGNMGELAGGSWRCFFRFQNVTIPKDATIDSAKIRFWATNASTSTVCNLYVHIEAADDPSAPTTAADLVGRSLGAAVTWNAVAGWTSGTWNDSPSIVTALQTHVERAGWASGNDLTIHVLDNGSDSNAFRNPAMRDYGTAYSAELVVSYTPNIVGVDTVAVTEAVTMEIQQGEIAEFDITASNRDGGANDVPQFLTSGNTIDIGDISGYTLEAWLNFDPVNIPAKSVILSAKLTFHASSNKSADDTNVQIFFEDVDDAAVPTSRANLLAKSLTSPIDWDAIDAWTSASYYDSPELKTILQDVIDRSGWASGQALQVILKNNSSTASAYRSFASYDHISFDAVTLTVNWSPPPQISVVENITITEYKPVQVWSLILYPVEGDDVGVSENVGVRLDSHFPEAGDDVAISESVDLFLGNLEVDAAEIIKIGEFSAGIPLYGETAEAFEIGDSMEAFNWSVWFAANKNKAIPRYLLTLTGAADSTTDVTIPISAFQARKRTGNPTYISAVVPGFAWAGHISDRANGELVISVAYEIDGTIEFTEEILRATLEEIRTDEGPVNRAISLSGNKTQTFINQVATVDNSIYRSVQGGNIVHRFAHIDPFLNPGDTCQAGDDEFTVDYIIYIVNEHNATMEVREG